MKKPQKKFKEEYKPTLKQRIISLVKLYFSYPFKIAKLYRVYNHGITELIAIKNEPKVHASDDKYYRNFQRRYTNYVYSMIFLPLAIGVLVSGTFITLDKQEYITAYRNFTKPYKEQSVFGKVKESAIKVQTLFEENPVKKTHIFPFFIFYTISIFGANFLSKNPVFKKQDNMANQLVALGLVDINGNPWKLIWTEEAMLITSFGADPKKIAQKTEFWTTINFPPSTPKQSRKDLNKFVVKRKNQQSDDLIFKLGDNNEPV